MKDRDLFWNLEALSDRQLLERIGSVLGSSRRLMAELIAHLGEVEERRLHLVAACSSMFAYCLKLGMTEDEAYRRIEVARLARRHPAIFPLLADGRLTISVVALLKHHLSDENHLELLAAVEGKTVVQTRELIAARFPRPDIASSVRKVPERRAVMPPSLVMSTPTEPHGVGTPSAGGTASSTTPPSVGLNVAKPCTGGTAPGVTDPCTCPTRPPHSQSVAPARASSHMEPLSAQRYKVQFTASAELARKLELARDLMRHSYPGGELGPVVERALDLLIESLMQRRFGKKASPTGRTGRAGRGHVIGDRFAEPDPAEPRTTTLADGTAYDISLADPAEPDPAEPDPAEPATHATDTDATDIHATDIHATADVRADRCTEGEQRAAVSAYIPRSVRRAVVERDGLGCSWVDEQGARCGSRAWLEYDHRHPRAKGGGVEADNLRLLCRSHNRFAAEREYGRRHVEHTIAERRRP